MAFDIALLQDSLYTRLSDPFLEPPVGEAVGSTQEAQVMFEV